MCLDCSATVRIIFIPIHLNVVFSAWPDTPAHITITAGTTSVTFSQTVPLVNGGSSITNYILEWKMEGADLWTRTLAPFEGGSLISAILCILNSQGLLYHFVVHSVIWLIFMVYVQYSETVSITSLKPSTSYFVRMAAHNRIGQGEFSSEYSIRTLPDGECLALSPLHLVSICILVACWATRYP